jgi:two-component system, chemotaxis family, response regulator PixG
MNSAISLPNIQLSEQLTTIKPKQFTGRLEIRSPAGKKWRLYFGLGKIVWASDACHPYRSWLRHLQQFCPQAELLGKTTISEAQRFECWKYYILTVLWTQKIITAKQFNALVENKINEVLFDILQHEANSEVQYDWQSESSDFLVESGLKMSLFRICAEQALQQSQKSWTDWCQKGLARISPNLSPQLKEPKYLQQDDSSNIYQNLVKIIDGKHTIRDLAVKMNQDIGLLARSFMTYVNKEYIELKEISDLSLKVPSFNSPFFLISETSQVCNTNSKPLIACIDDSLQVCNYMNQIVAKAGFRFMEIRDPLQGVSKLMSSIPDLIFLDIGMPILNGYELCAQLRRVSKLKEVPIIILTGRDGLVDRMRARLSGASGFMNKPIEAFQISEVMDKYLSASLVKV